jgi:predicted kinase
MMEILVGPIASGKSTYARKRAAEGALIINDDALVAMLHAGDDTRYNAHNKNTYKAIETAAIVAILAAGIDVVIDRPNHKRATRQRYIGLAKSFDAQVTMVMFKREPPEIHARRRFDSDSRGHSLEWWTAVARRHEAHYEPPLINLEHFDDILAEPTDV